MGGNDYRESEMHKSIMREKAKQDSNSTKPVKKGPEKKARVTANDSAFVKKNKSMYDQGLKNAKNRSEWSNPLSKAYKELTK